MLFQLNDWLTTLLAPIGQFDRFSFMLGGLILLDGLAYLPMQEVFFGKSESSGYQRRRPLRTGALAVAWMVAALGLMVGNRPTRLAATLFFYPLFRHYYINSRWNSIRRGGGAPGFMSHWTMFYLMLLQLSAFLDGRVTMAVATMARVDLAVIMICAGVYKYMIGYLKNDGMEYGRVNPMWGYHWRYYRHRNPVGLHETLANVLGSVVEIGAGLCMLYPGLTVLGSAMTSVSFALVGCLIRLGRLSWLMTLVPVICYPSFTQSLLSGCSQLTLPDSLVAVLILPIYAYLALLPVVKCTQYYNLFANRNLPEPFQRLLTRYANTVPIIIWRVFTPDVTNFYLRIFAGDKPILTEQDYGIGPSSSLGGWWLRSRFWHVTESITITSVFTTLKYFPSNRALFDQKILTYADSLAYALGNEDLRQVRFEYISIQKLRAEQIAVLPDASLYGPRPEGPGLKFAFVHVGNFHVDREKREVIRESLMPDFDFAAPSRFSPIRESVAPGSYVRKG